MAKVSKINVWHNTRGTANQYFICIGNKVLFQLPKWIGKLISWEVKQNE